MTNMTQFLTEIGEMNTQAQRVPGLEQSIRELQVEAERKRLAVEERETSILRLKSEMDTLNQKLRAVEVERDDYGFRKLEAEDRVAACTRSLKEILAAGESVLAQVDEGYVTRAKMEEREREITKHAKSVEDLLSSEANKVATRDTEITRLNDLILTDYIPKPAPEPVVNPPQEWKGPFTTSTSSEASSSQTEAGDGAKVSNAGYGEPSQSFDHGPEQVKPFMGHEPAPVYREHTSSDFEQPTPPSMPPVQHNPASEDGAYEEPKQNNPRW